MIEDQEKLEDVWNAVKEQDNGDVEKEWDLFMRAMVGCAEEVCGMR